MKTEFENNIKKQLEHRELEVSENAWDKLAQMMDEDSPTQKGVGESKFSKRKLWIPVSIAASILLFFTVYMVTNHPDSTVPSNLSPDIVSENPKEKLEPNEIQPVELADGIETENESLVLEKTPSHTHKIQVKAEENKVQLKTKEATFALEEKPETKENKPEIFEQKLELALQADSVAKPKEKKKYVDPEMLLYSIENNQSVKQNNSESRLVIIDFNK